MYENINGTLAGNNINYFFLYANSVTHGWFVLMMIISFFLIVLISSLVMQLRFTSRIRFEVSLLASSFATLGLATIIEQFSGLLEPFYFFILIGLTALSFIWVALSSE
jgi:hypothetical protein